MKILIAESQDFSDKAADLIRSIGDLELCDLDRDELLNRIPGVDVLWVRLRNYIDEEVMSRSDKLRVIVTPTTGLNHIDLEMAEKRNIQILCLRGHVDFLKDIRATAEHTIALMLALQRNIPSAVNDVNIGGWNRDRHKGSELFGKTVGIIGYGRVGRIVAKYLRAFDTNILVADPYIDPNNFPGVKFTTLAELFSQSDLVSVHVDLRKDTNNLIGTDELKLLNTDAVLINTSRGEIVDENALLHALVSGSIRGAALDVLCAETSADSLTNPLVQFASTSRRLLITPHIAGCTRESMEKTEIFMAKQLSSYI